MKLGIQLNVVGPYWFGGYKFDVNAENQNWIEFPARIQGKSIFRDFLKRFKTRIKGVKIEGTAEEIGLFSNIVRETLPEVELTTKEVTSGVQQTQEPEQPKDEPKVEEPKDEPDPEQPKEEAKVEEPAETKEPEPEQPKDEPKVEEPKDELDPEQPKEESKVEDPDPDPELVDEVKKLMEELAEKFSESEAAEFLKGQHDSGVSKVGALTALRDKLLEMKNELEAQAQVAEETKEPETPESPEQPQEEAKVEEPENPAELAVDTDPEPKEARVEEPKDEPEPQDPEPKEEE